MNWQRRKEIFFRKMKSGDYKELKRLILRRLFINLILWPVGVPVSVIFLPLLYLIEPFKKIDEKNFFIVKYELWDCLLL